MHYFEVYHRHFERFRGRPVTVVEFGVRQGGSLQMWRGYFGRRSQIVGVDIDPRCKAFEEPGIRVRIGDQEDRDFLRRCAESARSTLSSTMAATRWPSRSRRSRCSTRRWPRRRVPGRGRPHQLLAELRGGVERPGTFIEYAKRLIDQLNALHSREPEFVVDEFTRTTRSMHFYDSIVVFERGIVRQPRHKATGTRTFDGPPA